MTKINIFKYIWLSNWQTENGVFLFHFFFDVQREEWPWMKNLKQNQLLGAFLFHNIRITCNCRTNPELNGHNELIVSTNSAAMDENLCFDFRIFGLRNFIQVLQDSFVAIEFVVIHLHVIFDKYTKAIVNFGLNVHNRIVEFQFGT